MLVKTVKIRIRFAACMFVCVKLLVCSACVFAQEGDSKREFRAWAVGGGFATVNFDTKMKIEPYDSDLPIFIDLEGNLDLPSTNAIQTIFAEYTLSPRHQFSASYFGARRDSDIQLANFKLPDAVYLRAYIQTKDRTRFVNLHYKFTAFNNGYNKISAFAGIFLLDIDLSLDAIGTLEGGSSELLEKRSEVAKATAPLPLIGFQIESKLTEKWSISTMFSAITGSYDGDNATISQTRINTTYDINPRWVGMGGVTYFDAHVKIFSKSESQKIEYGYKGLYFGLGYRF
ncbi:hypothetical protein MARGE09_P1053 [Marinagarivorans cellulosilyticus]|uniref:Outer membrane protein beta-barrel domain-containing protein n=1 Tax=Marinagarivorans cellulosilyticus TaxID=2721545 RepID=A0AAN1WFY3_9GAMM|nr:hypothetical protein MARGE09_P1053 [Marinagarivorans cellulosilyticus]